MVVLPITTVMSSLRSSFDELRESLDLSAVEARIDVLRKHTEKDGFWESGEAQEITRELSRLQGRVDKFSGIRGELGDLEAIAELVSEEPDEGLQTEFYDRAASLGKEIVAYQTLVLLDGEYDSGDAILTVHAGAGGLDSQDWAAMLYRMYARWAEAHKYTIKLIDELPDQEAGIKSVTVSVNGDYAYGYLKVEQGVHRLVRISPFDSAKRRHTSFASVEVMPVLPDSVEIEIRPEDLKMDTFRASGAGGQYVNMTDSAVRITHIPTGIIVSCQTERSQHMNRATAMQVLRSKLFEKIQRERQDQLDSIQGEKRVIAWGSQIRSYTLQPFQLVKDHRSGCEIGNVNAVLDGDIDELIMAALRFNKSGKQASHEDDR
ncbi:MAG: peptide chain release factor 2 [Synergistaceae bacterium]|nr:peptide chain release factor 2 [Synergistaceae bacterium]